MRVKSFVRRGIDLEPIEIEVSLVPGIPSFHLIGLPDAAIKESLMRIRSALRHQGFSLPTRDQVLIHLKPSYEKKTSQGLDLAIAAAYLFKTEQIPGIQFQDNDEIYFYGEVSLEGDISSPPDLDLLDWLSEECLLVTGCGHDHLDFRHGQARTLRDLENIKWCEGRFAGELDDPSQRETFTRLRDHRFGETVSRLLTVVAAGEHNVFVAGPAGTGKTTFSEALHAVLRPSTREEWRTMAKITRVTGQDMVGRPLLAPHHSSTDIALLGGGVPPFPGEVTRAQHGVLMLDEFLEFDSHVKESLREPIEKHEITICRAGARLTLPADFLLVGATNLCPCGEYVPGRPAHCKSYSSYCKSYYQRLSGPLLDRFEVVAFSHLWRGERRERLSEIHERVLSAQRFAHKSRGQTKMNSRLTLQECEQVVPPFVREHLLPEMPSSQRRHLALLRVARTLADLEGSESVRGRHIEDAKALTIQPFEDIKGAWR